MWPCSSRQNKHVACPRRLLPQEGSGQKQAARGRYEQGASQGKQAVCRAERVGTAVQTFEQALAAVHDQQGDRCQAEAHAERYGDHGQQPGSDDAHGNGKDEDQRRPRTGDQSRGQSQTGQTFPGSGGVRSRCRGLAVGRLCPAVPDGPDEQAQADQEKHAVAHVLEQAAHVVHGPRGGHLEQVLATKDQDGGREHVHDHGQIAVEQDLPDRGLAVQEIGCGQNLAMPRPQRVGRAVGEGQEHERPERAAQRMIVDGLRGPAHGLAQAVLNHDDPLEDRSQRRDQGAFRVLRRFVSGRRGEGIGRGMGRRNSPGKQQAELPQQDQDQKRLSHCLWNVRVMASGTICS